MADDLNPAVIKRTQDLLGKYVKKPSLTEKLLKKPPFRFLHDIFSVVIRDTGCFVGLYTPEELTFENIKDRDDKMRFLQKMIDVVKITTNSSLTVRTSKIVAGHEPEKTNELLQLIGEIIEKKLDWQSAVEKVVSGKTPRNESPAKAKDKAVKESKTKEKVKEKPKEKESKSKDLKTTKTSSKTVSSTSNKDDKNKRIKEKTSSSSSKPTTNKDKTSKGTKEQDKTIKKTTKEATSKEATSKSKLTKTESQTSNKSTPSPNTVDSKTSIKSSVNDKEEECNHEELQLLNEDKAKVETPPINLIPNNVESINKEVSLLNDLNNANQEVTTLSNGQLEVSERNSGGKSKKSSAKTRKSSGRKTTEREAEKLPEKDNNKSGESIKTSKETKEKSEILEAKPLPIKQEQPLPPAPVPIPPQKEPTPPISLTNEVKRESTFTRENSKESSSNQSSIMQRPRTSLRPPSARPPSARPGAPRRRDKNVEIILQPNDQIKMSGIQVKLETFGDLDDDGENLVIIENPNASDTTATESDLKLTESEKIMQDETFEQGHLVQQILETQKELIQPNDTNSQLKNDKNSTNGLVMRQTSARHMNNLRDVIQNLTKSVNPLGKLMDFIPEDIDAMQLEFTMWRDAYTQAANELKRERSLTESATEPMKNQLVQIEANLTEYMEMIDASRVKILQNTEKILKMLTTS